MTKNTQPEMQSLKKENPRRPQTLTYLKIVLNQQSPAMKHLNRLVDDAVCVLRALPDDVQEAAARAIIAYGAEVDGDRQHFDE